MWSDKSFDFTCWEENEEEVEEVPVTAAREEKQDDEIEVEETESYDEDVDAHINDYQLKDENPPFLTVVDPLWTKEGLCKNCGGRDTVGGKMKLTLEECQHVIC